ncbi:unnamed protein product [Cylicocyclus nassatus]|uniref:Calmodulin-binding domain-containing protein n=1 Tax=Cylicocyclus nassatus TaxID=53992 RepID=A0AA36DQ69_CYLNA|nr:unnamed protein product [Cylicocyclus nassatus]
MRGRARSYCTMCDEREMFPSPIHMRNLHPSHLSQYSIGRETASVNNFSSSMSTLPTASERSRDAMIPRSRPLLRGHAVSTVNPRMLTVISGDPLDRRHGRSCDLPAPSDDDKPDKFDNPIAQVSSDILRVSGYTQQFRTLLTARFSPRRESVPNVHLETTETESPDEKYVNGGVRFDTAISEEATKVVTAPRPIRRRQSGYGISISSDSTAKMRCRMRKQLFIQRNKVCDLSLILGIAGLLFVIIDAELTALSPNTHITKGHNVSLFLRSLAVLTTICLMCCLINYHAIEVKIALIDSGADDWRVAVSTERIIKLSMELAICAVCPFPGSGTIRWPFISPETRRVKMVDVPIDVLLSVPMFLRSYLLCRFMVLHSKQFQDAATRSIAALNRISMDFRFVIKTMMADHPLRVLIVFTVSYWICMSWMFTQCERYDGKLDVEHYYLNSMWFIMVTFMSIGYGDIVPNTYCGRTLSITTGIVGAGVSSALIAVISRKLELSRAEKHVNNFMADSKLTNQRKNAAASVLQETWFIHKYKKALHKGDELRLRQHQRRFLHSINEFRRIKWDQRKLQEKGNSLLDVGKLHSDMHETLWEMHRAQDHFISQIDMLTQKIAELQQTLSQQAITPQSALVACCSQPLPPPTPMNELPLQPLLNSSASIPRISLGNNGFHHNNNGSLSNGCMIPDSKLYSQCQVDQRAQCPTGGMYATVTTPLMHSYEGV